MSLSRNWISKWKSVDDPCWEICHPWDNSCCGTSVGMVFVMFPRCFRVYLPLYLVSDLMSHGFNVKALVLHTLPNSLRSTTFLTLQGSLLFTFSCLLRKLLGRFYMYTPVFIPIACSSFLGILLERKERRPPLSSYMCVEAAYGLYYTLKSRGIIKSVPNGEVMLFSFALSVLCHSMEHHGKDLSLSFLRFLLNPYFPVVNGSIVNTLCRNTLLARYPTTALILSVAETCGWSFLIGYCGRSLSSMVTMLLRRKTFTNLMKPWLHKNNVQFGLFLAALTGIYKLSLAVFRQFLSLSKASLLAGALAGLSMLICKSPFTALYGAVKAIEILYWKYVQVGWLPSVRHANIPLYSLATAIAIHLTVCEPDNVSKQYWSFIRNITRDRVVDFDIQKLYRLGVPPSKRHVNPDIDLDSHHRTP